MLLVCWFTLWVGGSSQIAPTSPPLAPPSASLIPALGVCVCVCDSTMKCLSFCGTSKPPWSGTIRAKSFQQLSVCPCGLLIVLVVSGLFLFSLTFHASSLSDCLPYGPQICSPVLVTEQMQIKTPITIHANQIGKNKKCYNIQGKPGFRSTATPVHCW